MCTLPQFNDMSMQHFRIDSTKTNDYFLAATGCTYFGIELYGMSHSWRFHKNVTIWDELKIKCKEWNGMEYVECNGM